MEKRTKTLLIIIAVVLSFIAVWTLPAIADNYDGKLDLVQVTGKDTRFYVSSQKLSLYATGEYRDVLLHGFYKKSKFTIGYTPLTCPMGVAGKCGKVNFVSVWVSNF